MHRKMWWQVSPKLIPSTILLIAGAIVADHFGKVKHTNTGTWFLSYIGDVVFIVFAVTCLRIATAVVNKLMAAQKLGVGRAASIQFMLRLIGYIVIAFFTLNFLNFPVGKLLLGSAVIGIILGVAAQQALGNFFASLVLIISHPFSVGQDIIINSGSLGGKYVGRVKDIGLTHTSIEEPDGQIVLLPNATILTGASIRARKHQKTDPVDQT